MKKPQCVDPRRDSPGFIPKAAMGCFDGSVGINMVEYDCWQSWFLRHFWMCGASKWKWYADVEDGLTGVGRDRVG